jgi:hypothetical protein
VKTYRKTGLSIVLSFLCIALLSASASAQMNGVGFNIRGGLTTPVGDFNNSVNLGYGVRTSFYVQFSPVAAFGFGGGYDWFEFDKNSFTLGPVESGGDASILNVCPELTLMVGTEDMPTFSFVLGAGLYRLMQKDISYHSSATTLTTVKFDSVNKFGMNTTGRVVFPMSPAFKLGLEAAYHLIFSDGGSGSASSNVTFFEFMAVIAITTGT